MEKPKNYDETLAYTEVRTIPPGGYICKIKQVNETKSQNGKDMIAILIDIAEGEYKDIYNERYNASTKKEKKWGCTVYRFILDKDGNTSRGFKTFNTSVEESNIGFKTVWGDGYARALKGKLIGGVFGREQFMAADGSKAFSTKCMFFRSTEAIRKGNYKIPEDKLLDDSNNNPAPAFSYIVDDNINDFPF